MHLLEEQSSLSCEQRGDDGCGWAEREWADFISAVMRDRGLSYRDVERASERRLSRSRLGRILNEKRERRFPIKLAEVQILLRLLNIGNFQAALSIDMIKRCPEDELEYFTTIALMLSKALDGLPERIVQIVRHIEGLGIADILPHHGLLLQEAVVKKFEKDYREMVERRKQREARDILES